jgi:arylsulfate sulfotransferase
MQRDGTVVNEWQFFDLLDPYRIGYGSTGTGFYEDAYNGILEEPAPDWTHSNGIHYDEATNTALISSNHLSTVTNLDLETGEILWLLGDPRDWREPWSDLLLAPEDENMIWSYHHHSPKWTPDRTLLLYDNGGVRARPPDPWLAIEDNFSRAVEYEIDSDAGTVREAWSFGGLGDERFFSGFISEADWLPQTENILLTNGGRLRDRAGNDTQDFVEGHLWIQLIEVTHTTPAEKVWEVVIDDPRWGWTAFRTERIPRLNPKGQ